MGWVINDTLIGAQPIATIDTVKNHPLGTIVKATHETYGAGEFIYLLGVASTIAGSVVNYRPTTWQTALGVIGVNIPSPLAIAVGANVASSYGWYQIAGYSIAAKSSTGTSFAAGARVAAGTTSGLVIASASAAGLDIEGAVVAAVASATAGRTTVALMINRPALQGRVA